MRAARPRRLRQGYWVVDRIALRQIFGTLAPRFKKTLLALATHGDHDRAAAALGITRKTYNGNLSDARRAFYLLWHEGEQPSRIWAMDKRKRHGIGDDHTVMHSIVRRRKRQRARQARGQ